MVAWVSKGMAHTDLSITSFFSSCPGQVVEVKAHGNFLSPGVENGI